jgi:hypothetical protein
MKTSMSRSPAAGITITGHNDSVTETDVSDATVMTAGKNDRMSLAHVSDIAVDIRGDGDTITANGGDAGRVKLNFPFLIDGSRDHISLLVAVQPGTPVVPTLNLGGNISVGGNNDSVLVSFEAGSVNAPILIGGLNDNVRIIGNNDSVTGNIKLLAGSTAGTSATASLNRDAVVTGDGDQLNVHLQFVFNVVYTSHFNVTGNNDRPTENVTLNFGEVAITYTDQTGIAGDHNGVVNTVSLLAGNGMMTSSNSFAIALDTNISGDGNNLINNLNVVAGSGATTFGASQLAAVIGIAGSHDSVNLSTNDNLSTGDGIQSETNLTLQGSDNALTGSETFDATGGGITSFIGGSVVGNGNSLDLSGNLSTGGGIQSQTNLTLQGSDNTLSLSVNGNLTVPDSIQLANNLALEGNNNNVDVDLSLASNPLNPTAGGVTIANNAALQGNNNNLDLSLATDLLNPTAGGVTIASNAALDGSNNSVNVILSTDNLNPSGTSGQFVANLTVEGNNTVVNVAPGSVSFTGNKTASRVSPPTAIK